jgi:hypothetical protein
VLSRLLAYLLSTIVQYGTLINDYHAYSFIIIKYLIACGHFGHLVIVARGVMIYLAKSRVRFIEKMTRVCMCILFG